MWDSFKGSVKTGIQGQKRQFVTSNGLKPTHAVWVTGGRWEVCAEIPQWNPPKMETKSKTKKCVCHPSPSVSGTSIFPWLRIPFHPGLFFPTLILSTTICSNRPQKETTRRTFALKRDGKEGWRSTNRGGEERRRRPLAACFNSCVWCVPVDARMLMGIRQTGSGSALWHWEYLRFFKQILFLFVLTLFFFSIPSCWFFFKLPFKEREGEDGAMRSRSMQMPAPRKWGKQRECKQTDHSCHTLTWGDAHQHMWAGRRKKTVAEKTTKMGGGGTKMRRHAGDWCTNTHTPATAQTRRAI